MKFSTIYSNYNPFSARLQGLLFLSQGHLLRSSSFGPASPFVSRGFSGRWGFAPPARKTSLKILGWGLALVRKQEVNSPELSHFATAERKELGSNSIIVYREDTWRRRGESSEFALADADRAVYVAGAALLHTVFLAGQTAAVCQYKPGAPGW